MTEPKEYPKTYPLETRHLNASRLDKRECNGVLALCIRKVEALHEGSWDTQAWAGVHSITGEPRPTGNYTKRYSECIHEVVGDDPIAKILACLFTSGYSEMYEFADEVLGPSKCPLCRQENGQHSPACTATNTD